MAIITHVSAYYTPHPPKKEKEKGNTYTTCVLGRHRVLAPLTMQADRQQLRLLQVVEAFDTGSSTRKGTNSSRPLSNTTQRHHAAAPRNGTTQRHHAAAPRGTTQHPIGRTSSYLSTEPSLLKSATLNSADSSSICSSTVNACNVRTFGTRTCACARESRWWWWGLE